MIYLLEYFIINEFSDAKVIILKITWILLILLLFYLVELVHGFAVILICFVDICKHISDISAWTEKLSMGILSSWWLNT